MNPLIIFITVINLMSPFIFCLTNNNNEIIGNTRLNREFRSSLQRCHHSIDGFCVDKERYMNLNSRSGNSREFDRERLGKSFAETGNRFSRQNVRRENIRFRDQRFDNGRIISPFNGERTVFVDTARKFPEMDRQNRRIMQRSDVYNNRQRMDRNMERNIPGRIRIIDEEINRERHRYTPTIRWNIANGERYKKFPVANNEKYRLIDNNRDIYGKYVNLNNARERKLERVSQKREISRNSRERLSSRNKYNAIGENLPITERKITRQIRESPKVVFYHTLADITSGGSRKSVLDLTPKLNRENIFERFQLPKIFDKSNADNVNYYSPYRLARNGLNERGKNVDENNNVTGYFNNWGKLANTNLLTILIGSFLFIQVVLMNNSKQKSRLMDLFSIDKLTNKIKVQ